MANNKIFTPPYRLGRKQKRAVLDANGLELVIFPVSAEFAAEMYVNYLNGIYHGIPGKTWITDWA